LATGVSDIFVLNRFPNPARPAVSHPDSQANIQPHLPTLAGRAYSCQCGFPVFFRNSACLNCGTPLGYDPEQARLLPLMQGGEPDTWVVWQADGNGMDPSAQAGGPVAEPAENTLLPTPARAFARCGNLLTPAACNWLVPVDESKAGILLCRACRLNRIIPDLNDPAHPDNGILWGRIELAKRRLVSALLAMGLPVASRITEDTERGMMFDFLRSPDNGPHVMTGHNIGLITLNLQEADDAVREAARKAMREPYRTLLGHFRHEVGHYYWDRLVRGTEWMDGFHQLFGDENLDYAASLKRNYEQGPPSEWWLHYVSAYASMHPWEDWAECWAHYLHMRDTIDTALSFGLAADSAQLEFTPFTLDALYQPDHPEAQHFLDFLNDWTRLTTMLNEMSRSMGQPDFYPFVLPREVVAKLHFIHLLVTSTSWLPNDPAAIKEAQQEIEQQEKALGQSEPAGQGPIQEIGGQSQSQTAPDGLPPTEPEQSQSQSQSQSQGQSQNQSQGQGMAPVQEQMANPVQQQNPDHLLDNPQTEMAPSP
jgi:hypothetical protein